MSARPEHDFQVAVMKMARDVIVTTFRIRAFDRSKNHSGMQHLFEAHRGVRVGTPDVELIVDGRSINIELKAPGTKHLASHQPSENQEAEMALLRAAGAYAACAWSCCEVLEHWRSAGVPLSPSAGVVALDRDLRLVGAKPGVAPKARRQKAKPSLSAICRHNARDL